MSSLSTILNSEGFMPHGHCYLWTPGLLWTNVISDLLISLSYFSIPLTLVYFVQKRRDIPFNWMFVAFGIFILACGATHVMDVWTTWNPNYWLSGFVKVVTAAASVPTAVLLVRLVPKALAIPSPQQLTKVNAELTSEIVERKRIEQELRQEEERFRNALEHAPIGMAIVALQGEFVQVNRALCAIVGYEKGELEKLTFQAITHPDDLQGDLANVQQLLRGDVDSYQMEKRYLRKDGRIVWVQLTASVVRDDMGRPVHFIAQVQDIMKRRQADEELRRSEEHSRLSEAQLHAFMDNSPSIMFIKDLEGRYVHVNERFVRAFGLERKHIIARTDAELFAPEQASQYRDNDDRALAAGVPVEVEENAQYVDGVHTSIACKFPILDNNGQVTALGGVITDITEREKAERKIRQLNEDLQYQTAELIAANKEMEAFSYSVAHDLRAPLRHVLGFSKILTEEYGPQLSADARRHLNRVQDGAQHMARLVDALLSLAKIGRQSLSPQLTPLNSILQAVLEGLQSECSGRNIEWQVDGLFSVECDPSLMKQVFVNLLSNALKYTRPRDRATIAVGQMLVNNQPVIFVRDNGVGFDMRYADKLFGVFERLHRAQEFEGTGVGLATVERIIRRHGGRIWAEAEPDRGATFFFTIGSFAEHEHRTGFLKTEG